MRTHIAGIFASRLEVPIASPYALLPSTFGNRNLGE